MKNEEFEATKALSQKNGKGDYLQVLIQFKQVGPKVMTAKFAK